MEAPVYRRIITREAAALLASGRQDDLLDPTSINMHFTKDGVFDPTLDSACPEISKLLRLVTSAPVTSVEPERGFSALKHLLTRLRSTLTDEHLDMMMFVQQHAPTGRTAQDRLLQDSIDRWRLLKRRRIDSRNYNTNADKTRVKVPDRKKSKQTRLDTSFQGFKPTRAVGNDADVVMAQALAAAHAHAQAEEERKQAIQVHALAMASTIALCSNMFVTLHRPRWQNAGRGAGKTRRPSSLWTRTWRRTRCGTRALSATPRRHRKRGSQC